MASIRASIWLLLVELREELDGLGGTAGLLSEEAPPEYLRAREGFDAFLLSTRNEME